MEKVFISHANNETQDYAWRIKDCFDSFGVEAFLAREQSGKMDPGVDFYEQLENHIEQCRVFVIVICESTLDEHPIVKWELEQALKKKKKITPILYKIEGFPKSFPSDGLFEGFDRRHALRGKEDNLRELVDIIVRNNGLASAISVKKAQTYQDRLDILNSKSCSASFFYNRTILKHFVKRSIYYYGFDQGNNRKKISIRRIRNEIIHPRLSRNIILTGAGGSGKTTALNWLFLNSSKRGYRSVYISSLSFKGKKIIEMSEFLDAIGQTIGGDGPCLVFIDGIDEILSTVLNLRNQDGTALFDVIIEYIDEKSNIAEGNHKFVLSTRGEHLSLNRNIRMKKSKNNLDNYAVYEFPQLNKRESYKMCKSIKYLHKLDKKTNGRHFLNKWPQGIAENVALNKHNYLYNLRRYLHNTEVEKSLLSSPLLCRYAYPIICEWVHNRDVLEDTGDYAWMINRKIRIALDACIKWEYHDENRAPATADGGERLNVYKEAVYSFFTAIAGKMNFVNEISKKEWEKLFQDSRYDSISRNAALSILEETSGERGDCLAFSHQLFFEFYKATSLSVQFKASNFSKRRLGMIVDHMHKNHMVSMLFVEFVLMWGNNNKKGQVFNDIFKRNPATEETVEYIAQLFMRGTKYTFTGTSGVTFDDFFSAFPFGEIEFANRSFTEEDFLLLKQEGILKLEDIESLATIQAKIFNASNTLRGVVFNDCRSNKILYAFACYSTTYLKKDFNFIFSQRHIELPNKKGESDVSLIEWSKQLAATSSFRLLDYSVEELVENFNRTVQSVCTFLQRQTRNNTFWVSYTQDKGYTILELCKENEAIIIDLFLEELDQAKYEAYAQYLTSFNVDSVPEKLKLCNCDSIEFTFSEMDNPFEMKSQQDKYALERTKQSIKSDSESNENIDLKQLYYGTYAYLRASFDMYYSLRWRNRYFFAREKDACEPFFSDYFQEFYVKELFYSSSMINDLQELVNGSFFEESCFINTQLLVKKWLLMLTEQVIVLHILFGRINEVREYAMGTLELSKEFQWYELGTKLRQYVIDDDIDNARDVSKQLIEEFIWLPNSD